MLLMVTKYRFDLAMPIARKVIEDLCCKQSNFHGRVKRAGQPPYTLHQYSAILCIQKLK